MARPQTSRRNPPSTSHVRPAERKFYVWRDRYIRYDPHPRRGKGLWRWCCTLCDPPSYGSRSGPGGWEKIMTVSMPRHFAIRRHHHKIVSMR